MRDSEPSDINALEKKLEELARAGQLFRTKRHTDLGAARRQPDRFAVRDLFESSALLEHCLQQPDLAYRLLVKTGQPDAPTYVRDVLVAELLRMQSADIGHDHTMRGVVLAAEYQRLDAEMQRLNGKPTAMIEAAAKASVQRNLRINEQVANSYTKPLEGAEFGSVFDAYVHALKHHLKTDEVPAFSGVLLANLRDQFCRRFFGADYNGDAIEDFRGDALLTCREPDARDSVLNINLLNKLELSTYNSAFIKELEQQMPDEPPAKVYTSALDPLADGHRNAKRIMTKLIIATGLVESVPLLSHVVGKGNDIQEVPADKRAFSKSMTTPEAEVRFQAIQILLQRCFGDAGRKAIRDHVNAFRRYAHGGKLDMVTITPASALPDWKAERYPDARRAYWRVNRQESVAELTSATDLSLSEQAVEGLPAIYEFQNALVRDILESTVALRSFQLALSPDILVAIEPIPGRFPAAVVTWSNDERRTTLTLDDQLNLTGVLTETSQRLAQTLRTVAIAGMHDQLTINTITTRSERTSTQSSDKPEVDRPTKPVRVHAAGNFVVSLSEPTDPAEISHQVTPSGNNEIKVVIDRRAHWADLAPQLTIEARRLALQQLMTEEPDAMSTAEVDLLQRVMTQPGSHRLSVERIISDLLATEQRGKRLLDNQRPWLKLQGRISELEAVNYDAALQQYIGAEKARAQGPLPKILDIGRRMQNDQLAQQARGNAQAVPLRTRPTQTYVPSSRYEQRIPVSPDGVARTKQFTILRGKSALEAVWEILNR